MTTRTNQIRSLLIFSFVLTYFFSYTVLLFFSTILAMSYEDHGVYVDGTIHYPTDGVLFDAAFVIPIILSLPLGLPFLLADAFDEHYLFIMGLNPFIVITAFILLLRRRQTRERNNPSSLAEQ